MTVQEHEKKSFPVHIIKADEALGLVEAIVSVLGNIDLGDDIIHPGAFTKTIAERFQKIRVLDHHQTDSIFRSLGKPVSIQEVGREHLPANLLAQYPTAKGGLHTVTQFNMKTEAGREAFHRIAAGDINEYSIGFDAMDVDFTKEMTEKGERVVRNIRTVRMWEYSPVLWGMNPATATVQAKSKTGPDGEDAVPPTSDQIKELLGDGSQIQRLGDMLCGGMFQVLSLMSTNWLKQGLVTYEEFETVQMSGLNMMSDLRKTVSGDLMGRQMPKMEMWFSYEAGVDAEEEEQAGPDTPPTEEAVEETEEIVLDAEAIQKQLTLIHLDILQTEL